MSCESDLGPREGRGCRFCRRSTDVRQPSVRLPRPGKLYQDYLSLDVAGTRQTVVLLPFTETVAVDIRGEIANSRLESRIQGASVRQMTAQAHPRGAHPAIAGGQRQKVVYAERGVFVIGRQFLPSKLSKLPRVKALGFSRVVPCWSSTSSPCPYLRRRSSMLQGP